MQEFDAIIIGTGQAGPSLAARFAAEGKRTAIIEKGPFGGTCVNTGCTPTKTLVASAKNAHMIRRSSDFGIEITGEIRVDMKAVKARKDKIVSQSNSGLENWLSSTDHLTIFKGHARFESSKTISIDGGVVIKGKQIFINVGGRPVDLDSFSGVDYLTSTTIMDVDFVPEHLVVVGGSYIGLEFAQIYRRFGSEVTVIEKGDRLIRREDEDVSEEVLRILEAEGIQFRFGATCIGGKMEGEKVVVDVDCEKGTPEVLGSHVLLAIGRTPNTDDLGLEKAGVATNERGYINVDDQLRTNVAGIFALGDCNGQGGFTHTAYHDFEIAEANIFNNDPRSISDRILCYALYTDPALARIGLSESEAKRSVKN
ncbi:MAG: mercuric reductase, partial [Bacteroidota bacterium]